MLTAQSAILYSHSNRGSAAFLQSDSLQDTSQNIYFNILINVFFYFIGCSIAHRSLQNYASYIMLVQVMKCFAHL